MASEASSEAGAAETGASTNEAGPFNETATHDTAAAASVPSGRQLRERDRLGEWAADKLARRLSEQGRLPAPAEKVIAPLDSFLPSRINHTRPPM